MNDPIALYTLDLDDKGKLYEASGKEFDPESYSRMKYGVKTDIRKFASVLAKELLQNAPELFKSVRPPAILTSYKAAAPPSTTLARYCLDIINHHRFENSVAPGEMVQIYRPQDYIQEYAVLPTTERRMLLSKQLPNSLRGRDLTNYQQVLLDDIHVTGSYTRMIKEISGIGSRPRAAYLVICGPRLAKNPATEHLLNSSDILSPKDLLEYIDKDDFVFTRRFLKMLLKTAPNELRAVVKLLPDSLVEEVIRGILDTGAEIKEPFSKEIKIILDRGQYNSSNVV